MAVVVDVHLLHLILHHYPQRDQHQKHLPGSLCKERLQVKDYYSFATHHLFPLFLVVLSRPFFETNTKVLVSLLFSGVKHQKSSNSSVKSTLF